MRFISCFIQWFLVFVQFAGVVFTFTMLYWCLRGYIDVHFPGDNEDLDDDK